MRRLPPLPVLLYVGKWSVILAVALVTAVGDGKVVAGVAIMVLLLAGLWCRSRIAWTLLLLLESGLLLSAALDASPWWVLPLSLAALVLLLLPRTRRWLQNS